MKISSNADVVVIGSGPCGLLAALSVSSDRKVLLLEKPDKRTILGKRILVSGNGRANFFNEALLHGERKKEAEEFLSYLSSLGFSYYREGNLYYPFFNRSECLHRVLLEALKKNGNVQVMALKVLALKPSERTLLVEDSDGGKAFLSYQDAVLATGGRSYDRKDFDYGLLKSTGLSYVPFLPALCPVKTKERIPPFLKNSRLKGRLTVLDGTEQIYQEDGEVLFKEDGLSGIAVFNSTIALYERMRQKGEDVSFSYRLDYLVHDGTRITPEEGEASLPEALKTYLDQERIPYGEPLSFTFRDFYPFESSQVSYGGVKLVEVDPSTLQSKKFRHLYLGGEILDRTLPCGGFNMGNAFLDGRRIGKEL